ncbi:RNase adapter RapZ [Desulfocurvibacter africanus]|uniref:Putative P-loop-containing kinase n=1 Tax=Desulfocurvibacter africanus PCS TaxID=1262666 RepID=M5Q2R8_DESAF|nr:RNase adapter RapZ [Desulfocurvibacter africanus]EMG38706.1 putative P-loop-containing kinase [Desulfocurvibacter africanus PCS]
MPRPSPIPVLVLTGLSGAGKSTALNVFEDLGFFCVDGLPASMLPKLVSLYEGQEVLPGKGLALGMDIRQQDFLRQWGQARQDLAQYDISLQVIFIEAELPELMRRYATTRRPHPLESEQLGLQQALELERNLLEPVRAEADLVLDTTHYSVHDLRRVLQEKWSYLEEQTSGLRVHIISFGFKYGPPKEADLLFDLRFLPNPYFDLLLRPLTGKDQIVADYVFQDESGKLFANKLMGFVLFLLPLYAREGRFRVTIGLGCTGGRHRSVAAAEMLFRNLKEQGYAVSLEHRHIEKG